MARRFPRNCCNARPIPQNGRAAVIGGWIAGIGEFLAQNHLHWSQVHGVGLAIPGPYERYGVFGKSPNLPASFCGWDVHADYSAALAKQPGRPVPLVVGNDGNYGGVAEAQIARGKTRASVAMLMPGSGLGAAFVGADGLSLDGDTLAGMEAGHMPAPLQLLGVTGKPFPCGCGRDWGCVEAYTTISGLPYLLAEKLLKYPEPRTRPVGRADQGKSALTPQPRAKRRRAGRGNFRFSSAGHGPARRQSGDGVGSGHLHHRRRVDGPRSHHAGISRALPAHHPRDRAAISLGATARHHQNLPAVLGDMSQAIGAALVALYHSRG